MSIQAPKDLQALRSLLLGIDSEDISDPTPIIQWLERRRRKVKFSAEIIPLMEAEGWFADEVSGAIVHTSRQFFSVEAVRTVAGTEREVSRWDQPIFNQPDGGILALLCGVQHGRIRFLLQAKPEPGNMGYLQIAPSVQATRSNLRRAHKGDLPILGEYLISEGPATTVYSAAHNEEGGRFWRKTNENRLIFVDDIEDVAKPYGDRFFLASLAQIKSLCLIDNILSPFVKTLIAPI